MCLVRYGVPPSPPRIYGPDHYGLIISITSAPSTDSTDERGTYLSHNVLSPRTEPQLACDAKKFTRSCHRYIAACGSDVVVLKVVKVQFKFSLDQNLAAIRATGIF